MNDKPRTTCTGITLAELLGLAPGTPDDIAIEVMKAGLNGDHNNLLIRRLPATREDAATNRRLHAQRSAVRAKAASGTILQERLGEDLEQTLRKLRDEWADTKREAGRDPKGNLAHGWKEYAAQQLNRRGHHGITEKQVRHEARRLGIK